MLIIQFSQPFWLERNGVRPGVKRRLARFVYIHSNVVSSCLLIAVLHNWISVHKPGTAHTCGSIARAADSALSVSSESTDYRVLSMPRVPEQNTSIRAHHVSLLSRWSAVPGSTIHITLLESVIFLAQALAPPYSTGWRGSYSLHKL